jgi:hypothetical protein
MFFFFKKSLRWPLLFERWSVARWYIKTIATRRGAKADRATRYGKFLRLNSGRALRSGRIERSWRGAEARRQTESSKIENWQRATRNDRAASGEKKPGVAGSGTPNGLIDILEQPWRCRPGALTRPRGFAVRQNFAAGEWKAASRGKLLPERRADAHPSYDPRLDKTGCGEQRAYVTSVPGAKFKFSFNLYELIQ